MSKRHACDTVQNQSNKPLAAQMASPRPKDEATCREGESIVPFFRRSADDALQKCLPWADSSRKRDISRYMPRLWFMLPPLCARHATAFVRLKIQEELAWKRVESQVHSWPRFRRQLLKSRRMVSPSHDSGYFDFLFSLRHACRRWLLSDCFLMSWRTYLDRPSCSIRKWWSDPSWSEHVTYTMIELQEGCQLNGPQIFLMKRQSTVVLSSLDSWATNAHELWVPSEKSPWLSGILFNKWSL